MASYIGITEVKGRLKDNFASLYRLPAEQADLTSDIEASEAEVNASIGRRYALPITNAAALAWIRTLALDIFEARAWKRSQGDEIPKKIETCAKTARDQLADIAAGKVTIGGADGLAEAPQGGAECVVIDGNAPEFTRDQMEGF